MKATFIVDIERYIILVCRQRKRARHDTVDAKPAIKKLAKDYSPEILYGDRGYDDNDIFEQCFEELKAYPLIFQKNLLKNYRMIFQIRKSGCRQANFEFTRHQTKYFSNMQTMAA